MNKPQRKPIENNNPIIKVEDTLITSSPRNTEDLIFESIMRGGGEPFGPPFEIGITTLTEKLVKFFKQRSFFAFETLDKPRSKNRINRFTKYGASPFRGKHRFRSK